VNHCDRLSRIRALSQRHISTDHDYATSTREYQADRSSFKTAPTAAGLAFEKQQTRHRSAAVDKSLHIGDPIHR
jgi:hypothetical protein